MSHSEDIFVRRFGVQPARVTPLKSSDGLAPALEMQRGGGSSEKMFFPKKLKKLTPSLYRALGDMIFLLAVQAFEGDIEV